MGNAQTGKTSIISRYLTHNFSKNYRPTLGTDFSSTNVQFTVHNNTINIIFQVWDTVGKPSQKPFQPNTNEMNINNNNTTTTSTTTDIPNIPALENMSKAFFKSSDACILVYDITNAESFYALDEYFDIYCNALLIEKSSSTISPSSSATADHSQTLNFILFGNKSDLLNKNGMKREITIIQARQWCKKRMRNMQESNDKYMLQKYRILFYEISAAIDMGVDVNVNVNGSEKEMSYSIISVAFVELAKLCMSGNHMLGIIADDVVEENGMRTRFDYGGGGGEHGRNVENGTQTVCSVGTADLCFIL